MRILLLFFFYALSALAQERGEAVIRQEYAGGQAALQQGDLAGAEKCFLAVLKLAPDDVGSRVNLGVVCMREKKWPQAIKYLSEAEKLAPRVAGIRLNIGLAHYDAGEYAAAVPAFESVLLDQPGSVQARRLLGLCYLFEERYGEAASDLEPLWPVSNEDLSYLYSLAVAAGNSGQHALEEKALGQLMAMGKDSPLVHLLMGKAYLGHEDYEHALIELRAAEAADAKLPMVHYNLGVVYRHNDELDNARAEFLKDIAVEPGVAFNYDQLGLLASIEGHDHDAEVYFLDAVQRDARLGTSWFGLAKTYKQEKRYPEALKALDRAGDIDPKSASVHYLRAQIFEALGRTGEARTEFALVQRLKKENVDKLEQEVSGAKYRDRDMPAQ